MSEQSEVIQHLIPRQISLSKLTTVKTVVDSINETYGESINPELFEDRLAFTDTDGLLTIYFVEISTGITRWVFKDRYSIDRESQSTVENPKAFLFKEVVENFSTLINTEAELEFLRNIRLDVRYDSGKPGAGIANRLANLLNRYNIGNGWGSNPFDSNTTAYFVMRYIGPGSKAPDVYNFNRDAKLLVVVELMKHGVYTTHALMVG